MNQATHRDLLRAVGARRGRQAVEHAGRGGGQRKQHEAGIGALENLEGRVLMSALTYADLAERFDLPGHLGDIEQPGAEYVGFGHAGTSLGDLDGDGFGDFAISAPGSAFGADETAAGAVFVFSGQNGTLIRTLSDGTAGFGFSIANIGDVDGDGKAEILVGSPQFDESGDLVADQFGRAWVYSGADGTALLFVDGVGNADEFGYAVAGLGDVNDDGVNDFAVGAPGAGGGGEGQVTVFSGTDGAVIHQFTGEGAGHRFGAALFGADLGENPSVAGDGVGDILVGAPGSEGAEGYAGGVYLYDGATGTLRWSLDGENAGDGFGTAVAFVRGEAPIVYIGTPGFDSDDGDNVGRVYRYNQDGTIRTDSGEWQGETENARHGESIVVLGDISGDGFDDLAFISTGVEGEGRVTLHWGGSGLGLFFTPPSESLQWIGETVFAIGDIDNDGFADIGSLIGADGHIATVSSIALVPPGAVQGGSDDLSYVFSTQDSGRGYLIADGVIMSLQKAGLLLTDRLLGVNNNGEMVVRGDAVGEEGFYIIRDGVRTLLQDLLQGVPTDPAPEYSTFNFVTIGNGGDILFTDTFEDDSTDTGEITRSWVLRGTTLSFLFEGEARDVNDSGQILGVKHTAEGNVIVLRSASGQDEEVVDLADAWFVNNDGLVAGISNTRTLATWRDGEVTNIGTGPDGGEGATESWVVKGLSEDGRVLATYVVYQPMPRPSTQFTEYVYIPDGGLQVVRDIVFDVDAGDRFYYDRSIMIGSDGTIVQGLGFLTPVADDAPWIGRDGAPIWSSASNNSVVIAGVNQYGDAVAMRWNGSSWQGWRIQTNPPFNSAMYTTIHEVVAFTDSTETTHFFVMTDTYTLHAQQRGAGEITARLLSDVEGWTQMTGDYTAFESADGRVHLAGTDVNGDLVIYYESAPNANTWYYDNITTVHVEDRDAVFHGVESNLTALVTEWGTSHLFYLDETGALYSIWIGTGMTYWESTNISQHLDRGNIADDPSLALHGEITAYGTPWGGLNIAGTSVDGDPTAIWWVPGEGGTWHYNKIYGFSGQEEVTFNPASTTSYTAPWGSLHLASIQESGEIAVYWWGPGAPEWSAEILNITDRPEGLTFEGDITAAVMGETLNLFARGNDGDYYRMFWNQGDGGMWNIENVTESVA